MKIEAQLVRLRFTRHPDRRKSLFLKIDKELDEHMALEERTLYAACEMLPELSRVIEHSRTEHQAVKTGLKELEMLMPDSDRIDALLVKLFMSLGRHIHVEEDRVFPGARHGMNSDDFDRMNERILRLHQEMREPPQAKKAA